MADEVPVRIAHGPADDHRHAVAPLLDSAVLAAPVVIRTLWLVRFVIWSPARAAALSHRGPWCRPRTICSR
jgi:hypothetical protein